MAFKTSYFWANAVPSKMYNGLLRLLAHYLLRANRHCPVRLRHLLQPEPTATISHTCRLRYDSQPRPQRLRIDGPVPSDLLVRTADWRPLQPCSYDGLHHEKRLGHHFQSRSYLYDVANHRGVCRVFHRYIITKLAWLLIDDITAPIVQGISVLQMFQ